MYMIGIKEGTTVRYEEYESYTEAYAEYMSRQQLYGKDMWVTE